MKKKNANLFYPFFLLILLMFTTNCKKDDIKDAKPICKCQTVTNYQFGVYTYSEWKTVPDIECNKNCIPCGAVVTIFSAYTSQITGKYMWENCKDIPNKAPDVPVLISPANNSNNTTTVTLSWSCSDPDGNNLTYDIYFGKTNPPPLIVGGISNTTFLQNNLEISKTYYWKIVAKDCNEASMSSIIWSFNAAYGFPTLTTANLSSIAQTTATSGGNVTSDGGATVTARGVCWSTGQTPTIADSKTTDGTGAGSFTSNLTGLTANTTYYVRAYATNSAGTGYGPVISFVTLSAVPVLSTTTVSTVTQTSAQCGGTITSEGEVPVIARGVCWSTSQTPTIFDSKTIDGIGAGSFTSNLTGLSANTTYHVRAYATNNVGTGYGNTISFKTFLGTVSDIDGNVYNTIAIGSQVWMVENLKTTKYCNGDAIPNVTDNMQWSNLTTGAYCNYYNSITNANIYGRLYNWHAVNDSRKIAPAGWHVPTDAEWATLQNYLIANGYNYDGTTVGNKIAKSLASTTLWQSSTTTGAVGNTDFPTYRNKTGFTALPGGRRYSDGPFESVGRYGDWWSATEYDTNHAWYLTIYYNDSYVARNYGFSKSGGFFVRCMKD